MSPKRGWVTVKLWHSFRPHRCVDVLIDPRHLWFGMHWDFNPFVIRIGVPMVVVRIDLSPPECTGFSAKWCPVCGDCSCPTREGGDTGERTMEDPGCPLHAPSSKHGEGVE